MKKVESGKVAIECSARACALKEIVSGRSLTSFLFTPSLTNFALLLIAILALTPTRTLAQSSGSAINAGNNQRSLLNRQALEKALQKEDRVASGGNTRRTTQRSGRRRSEGRGDRDYNGTFGSSVQLETAEDVFADSDRNSQLMTAYKGYTYLKYFNDSIDFGDIYELNTDEAVTKRLMLIQVSDSFSKFIQQSPLADTYKLLAKKLRRVQSYTTVQVSHADKLKLHYAEAEIEDKESQILRFKIYSSARVGIEPRLELGNNMRLKYNPFEKLTALEYGFDF